MSVRNEIGYMEDRIESIIGQQLHLEVETVGVYDFEAVEVVKQDDRAYILCRCISEGRVGEGYLLRADDLGGGWWNIVDITEDAEWEQVKTTSRWQDQLSILHR